MFTSQLVMFEQPKNSSIK